MTLYVLSLSISLSLTLTHIHTFVNRWVAPEDRYIYLLTSIEILFAPPTPKRHSLLMKVCVGCVRVCVPVWCLPKNQNINACISLYNLEPHTYLMKSLQIGIHKYRCTRPLPCSRAGVTGGGRLGVPNDGRDCAGFTTYHAKPAGQDVHRGKIS